LNHELNIKDIFTHEGDMIPWIVGYFFNHFNYKPDAGFKLTVISNIPVGGGLGSSAALIISVLKALASHYQITLSPEQCLNLGQAIENMQHGHSSGVDIHTVCNTGYLYYVNHNVIDHFDAPPLPFHLIYTGKPAMTTGECVDYVKKRVCPSEWKNFGEVTDKLYAALKYRSIKAVKPMIKRNHRLLQHIGIVPLKVQRFINDIEHKLHAAGKICGAGAYEGESAGTVLVLTTQIEALKKLCRQYHYPRLDFSPLMR
jgi:mevalonate kinase